MPRATSRRFTAYLAVLALACTGVLEATGAPASAEPAPEQQRSAGVVTADSLPTAQINGVVWSQAIAGGIVYVGGEFTSARPPGAAAGTGESPRGNLMAYSLAAGALSSTFAPKANAAVKSVAVSPDGSKIFIGGSFTTIDGAAHSRLAAFSTSTGKIIASFTAGVDYTVNSVVATNTTVYVGGAFARAGSATRTRLAAFDSTNGALLNWAPTADSTVQTMVLTPDRTRIVVGGSFLNVNGTVAKGTASLNVTTGAIMPWALNTVVTNSGANSAILSLSTDGTSIYGGGFKFGTGGNLEGMFKADPTTGAVQWIEDCHGDTYGVFASGAAVYNVGHTHFCGSDMGWPQPSTWTYNRATAFTTNTTGTLIHDPLNYVNWANKPSPSLLSWFPKVDPGTYTGKSQAAWAVTGNASYVLLGGEFPRVNGVGQQGLARFAIKTLTSPAQGPQLSGAKLKPTLTTPVPNAIRVAFTANWDRDDRDLNYTVIRDGNAAAPVYSTTIGSAEWERPALGFLDKNLTAGRSYSYQVIVTDGDGHRVTGDIASVVAKSSDIVTSYGRTALAQGASLYWPLTETNGGYARDVAGVNDARWDTGVTTSADGAVPGDSSLAFSGAAGGDLASVGAQTSPSTFSAEAWFKTTSTQGGRILGFSDLQTGNSGHKDRAIYLSTTGKVSFGVFGAGASTSASFTSSASYNDGAWHQAVATMGGNGMNLFIDGVKVGSRSDLTSGEKYVGFWRVGGDSLAGFANGGTPGYLAGNIDEVSVYPAVLTQQQIDAQYVASGRTSKLPSAPSDNYGAKVFADEPTLYWRLGDAAPSTVAADAGSAGVVGTYQGSVVLGATGALVGSPNTAASFDGKTGFVSSQVSFANPVIYSVEAWFKTTTTQGGKIIGFGNASSGLSTAYDRHVYMQNDGRVVFGANNGKQITLMSPAALNNGQWHHVVGTQGPSGMALYVDGTLVGSNSNTGAQNYTGYWRVGADRTWGSTSSYFLGTIDEAAVYGSALTAAQVIGHYQAGTSAQ